jgi:hypothetical protein
MKVFLSVLPLVALGYLTMALIFLARRKAGYSHVQHTISEIGEVGAPDQRLVAFAVFLPVGLALAFVGLLLRGHSQACALACSIAVGYIVAAFFPCDPGSPTSGSARQGVHNLGGAVEYIGGGFSLVVLGEHLAPILRLAGFLVLGAAVALTVLPSGLLRGLVQRVAEVALFASASYVAWVVASGT